MCGACSKGSVDFYVGGACSKRCVQTASGCGIRRNSRSCCSAALRTSGVVALRKAALISSTCRAVDIVDIVDMDVRPDTEV